MPSLAKWFVELATTGKEKVQADIDAVGKKVAAASQKKSAMDMSLLSYGGGRRTVDLSTLGGAAAGPKPTAGGIGNLLGGSEAAGGMMKALGPIASAAGPVAIALVAVGIAAKLAKMGLDFVVGLIHQGLAGSNQMERFNDAMQRLADMVASSVLPILRMFTKLADQATVQLGNAMEHLQKAFADISENVAPLLSLALTMLVQAVEAASLALQVMAATTPQGFWRTLMGGGQQGGREAISRGGGQFEGVTEAFKRIQSAALRGPEASPEAAATERGNVILGAIHGAIATLRPAFGT